MPASPSSPVQLIEELIHNAKASGNRICERRLSELSIWFYNNKTRITDMQKKVDFLELSIWIMIEQQALLLERLHDLEGAQKGSKHLWLPRGMKMGNGADEQEFT